MISATRTCLAIVLAAGEGTRMNSSVPKVLHRIGNRSLIAHVLASIADAGITDIAVVVAPDRDDVTDEIRRAAPAAVTVVQRERRGTAHAVLAARDALARGYDEVLVLFADTPLVTARTLAAMRAELAAGAAVVALGFEARDPTGYGRFILADGDLRAIREHKDASEAERAACRVCNAGLMALDGSRALAILDAIESANAQNEFYLTDAVAVTNQRGLRARALMADEREVMGVNDRVQLAGAEALLQVRLRETAMRSGVTLVAPETVFLSVDTKLGRDILIEPHVVIGPGVRIADGAVVHAFSHLEGATVGEGASVGPYARLRPGTDVASRAKIGNFVEIKNATVEAGAKVNHLSYIGDARIGARANIGAGTITCNYDGFRKAHTDIGAGAFIGSNSALVAPVSIGDGAYVGSGSVITEDVATDALAIGRGRQVAKPGWAEAFRSKQQKRGPAS
jgi:bifunctional UDP-N-acetylglucosamine pyrophosphorylase/glucosamine-1-phosphate N-acetyltransferase